MRLKTLLIGIVLVIGGMITLKAQSNVFNYGAKLGFNLAWATDQNLNARPGVNAGIFAQYFFNDVFALQGEALFSMQGAKKDHDALKLNYINIPILAKFYPLNYWFHMLEGFNIFAGPQFGFNIYGKTQIYQEALDLYVVQDIKSQVKTFDFAIPFGIGYDFDFGLIADIRWAPSVIQFVKSNPNDVKSWNSVLSINVGYKF